MSFVYMQIQTKYVESELITWNLLFLLITTFLIPPSPLWTCLCLHSDWTISCKCEKAKELKETLFLFQLGYLFVCVPI